MTLQIIIVSDLLVVPSDRRSSSLLLLLDFACSSIQALVFTNSACSVNVLVLKTWSDKQQQKIRVYEYIVLLR